MPKGTIKADVMLRLEGWVAENEAPVMDLASGADDIPVGSGMSGAIEVSATRFYQLMKEQKANGRLPLFRLQIIDPDAQAKQAELDKQKKEDEKSPKLDLGKKKGDKPAAGKKGEKKPAASKAGEKTEKKLSNGEKAAAVRREVERVRKAAYRKKQKEKEGAADKPAESTKKDLDALKADMRSQADAIKNAAQPRVT